MSAIGQIPIAPSVTAPIPLGAITATSLASLTLTQQESIVRGTIVVTPTQSYVYTGYGDKTLIASYVELVSSGFTIDSELASHEADTTNVHGITNTAQLATTSNIETHRLDSTDVHGIYDTAYLTYKEENAGEYHRNLLGWPSASMLSPRGTEQSFHNYGSSPMLFDGTEGWSATSRPIYYVPIFIKNTASVQFSLRIPVKNYSGFISAALFAGDNYNATSQPTSNGHMTLVANLGTNLAVNVEDETAVFSPASFQVRRGWHFIAISFSIDPTGKVYRSVYSPNGPTPAEQMFGMQQRRSFIEDATEKQRRIGSVIRRVDGAPTWPPNTSTAPDLFNYVENPVTPKLIYQFNGPNGSVAVANPMNPRATYTEPSIDYASSSLQRFNDGNYPSTPTILSTSAASPQGGYNLLASAVPGAFNINTSTRFQIDFSSTAHRITEYRFYSRSTATGPTNIYTYINSGPASPSVGLSSGVGSPATSSVWQFMVFYTSGIAPLSTFSQLQIFGSGGSSAASSGNWRVDNIEIRGTYKHPDSPANWSGMTPGDHYFGFSEVVPLFYWGYNTLASGGGSSV
jgi:hypothetical protein